MRSVRIARIGIGRKRRQILLTGFVFRFGRLGSPRMELFIERIIRLGPTCRRSAHQVQQLVLDRDRHFQMGEGYVEQPPLERAISGNEVTGHRQILVERN